MDFDIRAQIKSDFVTLSNEDILSSSTNVLLGVTAAATEALKCLSITTVFDLATAEIFATAQRVRDAAVDTRTAIARFGRASADSLKPSAMGRPVYELPMLDVNFLTRIPDANAQAIRDALAVKTIRDLANYPPRTAAENILNAIYFPDSMKLKDEEQGETPDLVPATGEYPVEKVQYTHIVMEEIKTTTTPQARIDITSSDFAPIDLMALAGSDDGFKTVAFGALLTINQAWYAQGLALGQLLHSVALAPGESTRVAVLDWSRKTSAGRSETLDERTNIMNDRTSDRAINEVTKATASELQSGSSHSNVSSKSTQNAASTAGELSAPLGGLFGGPSGSMGTSNSNATSDTTTDGYSISAGNRQLGSSMMQNVHDRTHQNAHEVRGQRASVVMEVSESEKETLSTRVLANYNHMHALNIHYYEVIQLFKTKVNIAKAEKIVFIPFKLGDFGNDAFIRRFQGILANAAPTAAIRDLIQNSDVVQLTPEHNASFSAIGGMRLSESILSRGILSRGNLLNINPRIFEQVRPINVLPGVIRPPVGTVPSPGNNPPATENTPPVATAGSSASPAPFRMSSIDLHRNLALSLWDAGQASRLSALLNRLVLRPNSTGLYLPVDVSIVDTSVAPAEGTIKEAVKLKNGSTVEDMSSTTAAQASEVEKIFVRGGSPDKDINAKVTLTLSRNGVVFPLELPAVKIPKGNSAEVTVVNFKFSGIGANLKQYLKENTSYYNMAILKSLNTTQIAMLLAGYDVKVGTDLVPVAQLVEPRPLRYVGNYLAFKMAVQSGDSAWGEWLNNHGINLAASTENLVPMPTGGTFAEAVLGRSNSAEKLDMTRFWNWQDSPIPLAPTEIAAIQTGSRSQGNPDLMPTAMSTPIVNMMQPPSMPDPTGTAAILAAIQNGSMFRDMSGFQALINAGQAATKDTQAGAASAGQQAGENMNNLLKANTERQRVAAEMITSLAKTAADVYTGGLAGKGGSGISGGNHSQEGAKINYFDKTAKTETVPADVPAAAAAPTVPSGTTGSSSGTTPTPTPASSKPPQKKTTFSQNPAARAAVHGGGDTKPKSEIIEKILDTSTQLTGQTSKDPLRPRLIELRMLNYDNALLLGDWTFNITQRSTSTGSTLVGSSSIGETSAGGALKVPFTPIADNPELEVAIQGTISNTRYAGSTINAVVTFTLPAANWSQNEAFRADLVPHVERKKVVGKDFKEVAEKLEVGLKAQARGEWAQSAKGLAYKVIELAVSQTLGGSLEGDIRYVPGDETRRFENETEMEAVYFTEGMDAKNVI